MLLLFFLKWAYTNFINSFQIYHYAAQHIWKEWMNEKYEK